MMTDKRYLNDVFLGPIIRFTFVGEDLAVTVVTTLVRGSAWFELMPLPDDEWRVDVKRENERFVEKLLDI